MTRANHQPIESVSSVLKSESERLGDLRLLSGSSLTRLRLFLLALPLHRRRRSVLRCDVKLTVHCEIEALGPLDLNLANQTDCLAVREKDSESLSVIEDTNLIEKLLFNELTVALNDLKVFWSQGLQLYLLELLKAVFARGLH